jgi:hypothetical protein
MKRLGRIPFAMAALWCGLTGAVTAAPDPYEIFAQARTYWEGQKYPPYIGYDIAVQVEEGGKSRVEHYDSAYNAVTGDLWVDSISDYETAHPVKPSGFQFNIMGLAKIGKPLPPVDFVGVPLLAPTYSFGIAKWIPMEAPHAPTDAELIAQIRQQFHDPNPRAKSSPAATPASSGLQEIATVIAFKRDYAISLLGIDTIDGRSCYHLGLRPLHDQSRYRLRELWIDQSNYATVKLKEALNFVDGPGTQVPWTVTFADVDGAHYVAQESADVPMSYRGLIYTQTRVTFENIHPMQGPESRPLYTPVDEPVVREP